MVDADIVGSRRFLLCFGNFFISKKSKTKIMSLHSYITAATLEKTKENFPFSSPNSEQKSNTLLKLQLIKTA